MMRIWLLKKLRSSVWQGRSSGDRRRVHLQAVLVELLEAAHPPQRLVPQERQDFALSLARSWSQ
jgi:hypothetical protein